MRFTFEQENLKEIENELSEVIFYRLEFIRGNLEEQFQKEDLSACIAEHLNQIYCSIDKVRVIADDSENYNLIQRINSIHENIALILIELKNFSEEYQKPIPSKVFENLKDVLNSCSDDLENLSNALSAIKSISASLKKRCNIKTLEVWAGGIELFAKSLKDNIELFSFDLLQHLEDFCHQILQKFSKNHRNLPLREEYKRRIITSAQSILNLIEQRRLTMEREDEELVQDLLLASESAFNEIWLDSEEEEAWGNL